MKICFVTTGDIKDIATSKRALGLANPLIQLGWEVHISMEDAAENKLRVGFECSPEVQIHYFNKSGVLDEIRAKNRLIKQIHPDYVYICAFVFRNIVGIGKSHQKLVEHSELQSAIPTIKGLKKILTCSLEYFSIFYADGLLCASRYLEKVYTRRSKLVCKKTPVLYFPYAFSENLCKPRSIADLPENFSRLTDKKNFVFLGSIAANYGIFTMLEAFKLLSANQNDIRLILLGKGRHYNEAVEFVKDHKLEDSVLLPGFVAEEDIANYFSIATAFLSPMNDTVQDWARCPSKLYMYLPFQKPIITCKIGEPFEVLGDNGYYYEPGKATLLAEKVMAVFESKTNSVLEFEKHTWFERTNEFDKWIKNNFK